VQEQQRRRPIYIQGELTARQLTAGAPRLPDANANGDRTGREHLSRRRPQDLVQQQTAGHCGIERVEVIVHGDAH
jgi:hypothetical protein